MKTHFLFLVGLLSIFFISCTSEPVARISADKTEVEVGENITFSNTSEDSESYLWEFGDGSISVEREPVKSYSTAGDYTVVLTAYSGNEKKEDRATLNVKVNEKESENENGEKTNEDYEGTYDGEYTGVPEEEGTLVIEKGSGPLDIKILLEIADVDGVISGNTITIPEQTASYQGISGNIKGSGTLADDELSIDYTITVFGNELEGNFTGTKRP